MAKKLERGKYLVSMFAGIGYSIEAAGPKRVVLRRLMSNHRVYLSREYVEQSMMESYGYKVMDNV